MVPSEVDQDWCLLLTLGHISTNLWRLALAISSTDHLLKLCRCLDFPPILGLYRLPRYFTPKAFVDNPSVTTRMFWKARDVTAREECKAVTQLNSITKRPDSTMSLWSRNASMREYQGHWSDLTRRFPRPGGVPSCIASCTLSTTCRYRSRSDFAEAQVC